MNGRIFDVWIETQLAPTLSPGDVVILDNVSFHKSERAERLVKDRGAWLRFLPPYSPDLNGLLKTQGPLEEASRSQFDVISKALGDIIDLFSVAECRNFFKAAGYEAE